MQKLAIVTTHPIQYYAPVFKLLTERSRISVKVFYTSEQITGAKFDEGFQQIVAWDIDLLEGYLFECVENVALLKKSQGFSSIITPELIAQIKNWQANALLVIGWSYQSHLMAMLYFKGKLPVYFRGDSTLLDDEKPIKAFLRKLALKWVYKHINYAFYVGTNNKAYFTECGLNSNRLFFAPHAIDNKRFSVNRAFEANQLRLFLGVQEHEILILFAGKFEDKKNPLLLLSAFLASRLQQVHLLFCGSGKLEQKLKKQAAAYGNIHFLPFHNQSGMPVVYQSCDLFCLPSKGPGETWGLAVNEAMACGKAVLVSNKCGCAVDLVTPANGKIFKSGIEADLIASLKELTLSKEHLYELGNSSKQIIASWNFEQIAVAIENNVINEPV